MTKKYFLPFIICVFVISSCQQGNNKNLVSDSTSTVSTTESKDSTSTTEPADATAQQMSAADTLFKDGTQPTSWTNAGFDDPTAFKKFLVTFKDWVKNDNSDSIAAHIKFPLQPAKTIAEFKMNYKRIFSNSIKAVVAQQRLDRIFRNANGAMIGSGQIWFIQKNNSYLINAINLK